MFYRIPHNRKKRLMKAVIHLSLIVFCFQTICSADMVWSNKLNRLVRIGEEIKTTDQEQFEYIKKLDAEGKKDEAITACHDLINFFPQSGFMADVYYIIGKLYEETDENWKAFEMYQRIVQEYPQSPLMQELLDRQFAIGVKFLEGERLRVKGIPTVPSPSKAIEIFEQVKKSAPFHEYGEKSQFYIGLAYEKKKDYEKALEAFQDLLDEYPNTTFAAEASFKMADVSYRMSQKNIDNEPMLESAGEKFDEFITAHPEELTSLAQASDRKTEVLDTQAENLYKIGRFYETQRHIESANIYYELIVNEYPGTEWKAKAEQRMAIFADPEGALLKEEKELCAALDEVQEEINSLKENKNSLTKQEYDEKLVSSKKEKKRITKGLRHIKRQKVQEIKLRWAVHKRQVKELKENKKSLARKKASLSPKALAESETFLKTWEDSIKDQEFLLDQEAGTLKSISEHLGYRRWSIFAFLKSPIELANVDGLIKYKEKKIAALRQERQSLGGQIDVLVQERETLASQLGAGEKARVSADIESPQKAAVVAPPAEEPAADRPAEGGLLKAVTSRSLDVITSPVALVAAPFRQDVEEKLRNAQTREEKLVIELEEVKTSLSEIDRLMTDAGDTITAENKPAEERSVRAADQEEIAEREQRRAIKAIEKKINEQYRIIDDAEKNKREFAKLLIKEAKEKRFKFRPISRVVNIAIKPVVFIGKGVAVFLFGLEEERKIAEREFVRMSKKDERTDGLHDKMLLEQEKINAAKIELKKLYDEREQLPSGKKNVFKSILIFPENIFAGEKEHARQTQDFLIKMKTKQSGKYAKGEKELEAVREEIAALEEEYAASKTDTVPAERMEELTVVTALDDTNNDLKDLKQQYKKNAHALERYISKAVGVLEDEEKVERNRLAKIDKVIKKHEGSDSEKLQKLLTERKTIFEDLDEIMTTRERYLVIAEDIKNTE
jgi:outer membrane protein assembly factor BamD